MTPECRPTPPRIKHRQIERAGSATDERLTQLDAQGAADRECIEDLIEAMHALQGRVESQDLSTAKVRRDSDTLRKHVTHVESGVLKSVDNKAEFLKKGCLSDVEKLRQNIEEEITSPGLFRRHLYGHPEPIIEPIIQEIMEAKAKGI